MKINYILLKYYLNVFFEMIYDIIYSISDQKQCIGLPQTRVNLSAFSII